MKKREKKKIDPFFEREARKYKKPIPSREFIMQHLENIGVPEAFQNLRGALKLRSKDSQEALRKRLNAMIRDGQILTDRRGRFALVKKMDLIQGYIVSHRDGYGFLVPDDSSGDLFLSPKQMRALFPGDRVLASVISRRDNGKCEGAVVDILARHFTHIIGRYSMQNGLGYIVPTNPEINQEIVIPKGKESKAKRGDIVLVEILGYPTIRSGTTARVVEILGKEITPDLEVKVIINSHGLSNEWSKQITRESKQIARESGQATKSQMSFQGRIDLRNLPFVTIDGEDAKDFDDAVYCEWHGDKWILYVAIADVGHYVGFNTAIDQEALHRGNSVYFPGYVIPMLPEILCNDLCSLKPLVDRLAMVCEMEIDVDGKVTSYKFYEASIKSRARLTYDNVYDLLEEKNVTKNYLMSHLINLHSLYQILLRQRNARGTLDFSRKETKIEFDDQGKIGKIVAVTNHYVHGMIEEFMLVTNVCAAKFLLRHEIPALYRVHEPPDGEKLAKLRTFLKSLNLELRGGNKPKPLHYAQLLARIANSSEEHLVQTVLLRSLRQAVYTPVNVGHFGLAYGEYAHFTSPIRRYPDLINHRAIKHLLRNKSAGKYYYKRENMQHFASHCSFTERRADDASRSIELWHKCQFMRDKIGKMFDGIVSGVTNFGLFVELRGVFVEGLVHVTSLKNDYYCFDQSLQRLVGRRTNKAYCLGDPLRVLVAKVDVHELEISLELI